MTPNDRLRLDLAAARYLNALECGDAEAMSDLWRLAATDAGLLVVLREVHAGLVEEQQSAEVSAIAGAVAKHLPSAAIVRPEAGPVTVADVAEELFRHTPDQLPGTAHALNDQLRASADRLPDDLGLSKLVAWAEARFGSAPAEYWRAFRQAALKLELRRAATAEYSLAARPAPPKPEDRK